MYQSLEHTQNPKLVLEKCYNLLSNGGILIIEVPNLRSFDFKISKKRRFGAMIYHFIYLISNRNF